MADALSKHHGGDGGKVSPKRPTIVYGDCESTTPPKKSQHSKSLIVYQLFNKIGKVIPIQFDFEGQTFYVRHIDNIF